MSDATIRAALHARLLALTPAIGRVHDYDRWVIDPRQWLALFQNEPSKKIFGWEITRTGFKVGKAAMNKWRLSHRYVLRGFYALADAVGTEKAINALADLIIIDLVRTRLPGTENDLLPEGSVEVRMFGQVLCHVIEIRLPEVAEIVSPAQLDAGYLDVVGLNYYLTPDDGQADAVDLVTLWDNSAGDAVAFDASSVTMGGEETAWAPNVTMDGDVAEFDGDNPTFDGGV